MLFTDHAQVEVRLDEGAVRTVDGALVESPRFLKVAFLLDHPPEPDERFWNLVRLLD